MKVKIINTSTNPFPEYATAGSAGMDLYANITEDTVVNAGFRKLIPTGIKIQLPVGYEAQVRPRSGLTLKHGITVLNTPGTIDSDYTGEIGVILFNSGQYDYTVKPGDRIAQLVVAKYETVDWDEVSSLEETERNDGGFGHTGNQ